LRNDWQGAKQKGEAEKGEVENEVVETPALGLRLFFGPTGSEAGGGGGKMPV